MKLSIDEADGQLAELVRIVEAGEEVILTRAGRDVFRLVHTQLQPTYTEKLAVMEAISASGRKKATAGPDAAHSHDFLYGDDGLPV